MSKTSQSSRPVLTINVSWVMKHRVAVLLIVGAIITVVSSAAFAAHNYTKPKAVWYGMLHNSLSTISVTRKVNTDQQGQTAEQSTQLSFADQPASHALITLKQKGEDGKDNEVKTETIGTKDADYSRYLKIKTSQKTADGKDLDYSKVENIWAKSDGKEEGSQPPQYLQQAALGLVPFGNLPSSTQQRIIEKLEGSNAYKVDFSKIKSNKLNGKSTWEFPVSINIAEYVDVLKTFSTQIGLGDLASLNADEYRNNPPVEVTMTVSKYSRQLLKLSYKSGGQDEIFTSYGIKEKIAVPTDAIPLPQLQQKIQDVK